MKKNLKRLAGAVALAGALTLVVGWGDCSPKPNNSWSAPAHTVTK